MPSRALVRACPLCTSIASSSISTLHCPHPFHLIAIAHPSSTFLHDMHTNRIIRNDPISPSQRPIQVVLPSNGHRASVQYVLVAQPFLHHRLSVDQDLWFRRLQMESRQSSWENAWVLQRGLHSWSRPWMGVPQKRPSFPFLLIRLSHRIKKKTSGSWLLLIHPDVIGKCYADHSELITEGRWKVFQCAEKTGQA
ncbi:hypothetical protein BC830DRAFT_1090384 [Chytriomyces sp. MP71]|nr:hypothetical protein BC830DRAFT_1090384 [Chytriomyces sp. MP71]